MKASRRSVLRASLAAPLVLTVTAAQGQAISSSVACLRRDSVRAAPGSGQTPVQLLLADGDDWLRVSLSLFNLEVLVGSVYQPVPGGGEYFRGFDQLTYWLLQPAAGGFTASPSQYTISSARPAGASTRSVFALVYVNAVGQVTGFAAQPNGGSAVTGTCLVSAAPGTVLPSGTQVTAQSRRTQSSVMWRRSQ